MNDELWLHPVKWWPFYWYSQAKCHYLYSKIGATIFSEAEFAPSWLAGCRPAKEFLLLAMTLKIAWHRFTSQFLECSHCLHIKPPSKLPKHINKQLIFQKWPLYALSGIITGTCFVLLFQHICMIYLMYSKCKSNSLDNELLFITFITIVEPFWIFMTPFSVLHLNPFPSIHPKFLNWLPAI